MNSIIIYILFPATLIAASPLTEFAILAIIAIKAPVLLTIETFIFRVTGIAGSDRTRRTITFIFGHTLHTMGKLTIAALIHHFAL